MSLRVLIVDDELLVSATILEKLSDWGYQAEHVPTAQAALEHLEHQQPDVILLDLALPDAAGLDLIPAFAGHPAHAAQVIIITAEREADVAVAALKRGAWDYLVKPLNYEELHTRLQRLARFRQLEREAGRDSALPNLRELRPVHPQLRAAYKLAAEAASSPLHICILGQFGTGRLRLARLIHQASPRSQEPLVSWTATIDPDLRPQRLAELLGAEPNALNHGSPLQRGLLELAGEGTVVLREVQFLGASEQRVLEQLLSNRTYNVMGGGLRSYPGRLLFTATPDLEHVGLTPDFNADLRRQILSHHVSLPALQDRQQDIYDLLMELIAELNKEYGTAIRGIEPAAVAALLGYNWPGNISEVKLVLERLWPKLAGNKLLRKHLPQEFLRSNNRSHLPNDIATLAEVERQHILKVMDLTQGNQTQAARMLDIARSTLIAKLKHYQDEAQAQAIEQLANAGANGVGKSRKATPEA